MENINIEMLRAKSKPQYKYPFIFLTVYITLLICTTSLANRLVLIGSILEPGGIFAFPLTFTICDIVGEVYGYAYPRLFIWLGVLCEFIFAIMAIFVSHLPHPGYFKFAVDYQIVFDPTLRYVFSGLAALLIGEFVNIYLLTKLKVKFHGKIYIFRSLFSTAIGQLSLSIIAEMLIFAGKLHLSQLLWITFCSYSAKMIWAIVFVFPSWVIIQYLKKAENVDHYDINTNFNPFILSLENSVID